jgi:sec-independent protein translocase protein TatC
MPFLDHLEELRWRIFKSAGALFVGTIVGFLLVHYLHVTDILVRPIAPYLQDGRLAVLSPLEPFLFEIKLSILVALLLAFPVTASSFPRSTWVWSSSRWALAWPT